MVELRNWCWASCDLSPPPPSPWSWAEQWVAPTFTMFAQSKQGLLVQSPVKATGRGQMWACFLQRTLMSSSFRCRTCQGSSEVPHTLPAATQYLLCCCQRLRNMHWQPGLWDSILVWKHKLDSYVVYNVVYTTWLWLTQLSVSNFTLTEKLEAFSYFL